MLLCSTWWRCAWQIGGKWSGVGGHSTVYVYEYVFFFGYQDQIGSFDRKNQKQWCERKFKIITVHFLCCDPMTSWLNETCDLTQVKMLWTNQYGFREICKRERAREVNFAHVNRVLASVFRWFLSNGLRVVYGVLLVYMNETARAT